MAIGLDSTPLRRVRDGHRTQINSHRGRLERNRTHLKQDRIRRQQDRIWRQQDRIRLEQNRIRLLPNECAPATLFLYADFSIALVAWRSLTSGSTTLSMIP